MKNLILRYGLYSGALSALFMSVMAWQFHKSGNMSGGEVYGYGGMILSMLFVYLGVRLYRDRERSGVISFGEAFKVGGLIALISCVCYVVAWMLLYEFVMPDFMEKYASFMIENMKAKGADEIKIQETAAQMEQYKEMYKNPLIRAGMTFVEPLPVALFMSLVSAGILRKKA